MKLKIKLRICCTHMKIGRYNHYIKPNWKAPSNVFAVTTLRCGGFSQFPYDSFNLADHVGDELSHVQSNREKLRQELELINEPIWLKQIHSNKVINIDNLVSHEADASYTTKDDLACVILTADCLPILLCDQEGTTVAAIHAGWKSLSTSIIENTINAMNIDPKKLLVWLGPAISKKAFEVGEDVYEKFVNNDFQAKYAFQFLGNNRAHPKWLADIYALAKQHLIHCNIIPSNINGGEYCTYSESSKFFSYRRDGEKTGRIASLIWMTA